MNPIRSDRSKLDLGLLLMRVMLAVVFLFHGSQKLFGLFGGYGISGTAQFMESIGLPLPVASALLAGLAEFLGGLSLLTGFGMRYAMAPLAFTMLVAAFVAHSGFDIQQGGMEYPLTLAVVTASLGLTGPGRFALATGRARELTMRTAS